MQSLLAGERANLLTASQNHVPERDGVVVHLITGKDRSEAEEGRLGSINGKCHRLKHRGNWPKSLCLTISADDRVTPAHYRPLIAR